MFLGLAAVLVAAFSVVLYLSLASNIESNVNGDFPTEAAQDRFVSATVASVRDTILVADLGILLVVSAAAYALARRTLRPVQRNVDAQKQFVSNASHELRTPLAIMKTEFEVAEREDRESLDVEGLLDGGLDEVGRMSRIVEDLLTLSRIDADQEALIFREVDASALVERAVERMRVYADGFSVRVAFSDGGPASVQADADHLERALVNLIKNAIEHSPAGAAVHVGVASEPHTVQIDVRDVGEGIPAEDLPHVFERFYRAKASEFRSRGGSGLGLSITRWVVEQHHGSVQVQSVPGQGTTVAVVLPASRASRSLHAARVG